MKQLKEEWKTVELSWIYSYIENIAALCRKLILMYSQWAHVASATMPVQISQASYKLMDISQLAPGNHELRLTAKTPDGRFTQDTATLNTQFKDKPIDQRRHQMHIELDGLRGPRVVDTWVSISLFYHEWDLPGAKFDRLLKTPRSSICTGPIPGNPPFRHNAGSVITVNNGAGSTGEEPANVSDEDTLDEPGIFCKLFSLDTALYAKSGSGKVSASFVGDSNGPLGTSPWYFWPSWPTIQID